MALVALDATLATSGQLFGDIKDDEEVNFADFLILSANFGESTVNGVDDGDLNEDGRVDFADFLLLSAQFGQPLTTESIDAAFA